ncbi:membrane magnesium transporter [Hirsutella rhossiliensis]|uniref:Membrane magnesium transporter domain-containing protein n=1 Tax=Hirsutella rhossiliensis TaxID=111463 RepID=A0A9P8SFE5_9HYPO|nr:membrane magnesium transporter domain-containing protein [Hirsutella rhossiliensis]KAH0960661.1 membrane magnesium transporter domain-containing protein [Hirsutella rhossiliensis]
MTWTSRSVTVAGLVLLAHACYSAQEHAVLYSTFAKHMTSSQQRQPGVSLPIDICIETVAATLIMCLGLVLGSQTLRPIQWRVWAGKIEREGDAGFIDGSGEVDKEYRGSPFGALESRPGFVDIRKQQREFAQWVKNGGSGK